MSSVKPLPKIPPSSSSKIEVLRQDIDSIDKEILRLISERRSVSEQIRDSKEAQGVEIRDGKREREILLSRAKQGAELGLEPFSVNRIFKEIISDSVQVQSGESRQFADERFSGTLQSVGLIGVEPSLARDLLKGISGGENAEFSIFENFGSLGQAVARQRVDAVLIPFERSGTGIIDEAFSFLVTSRLAVIGEIESPERISDVHRYLILAPLPGVGAGEELKVVRPSAAKGTVSFPLASRAYRPEGTVVTVGDVRIGAEDFVVFAGPCAVESYEQIMVCAREVKQSGGVVLRGGCFKSRTSPYSFQGLGYEGLDYLVDAGRAFGLPVITEVLAPEDVEQIAHRADILQIGARNMQNFPLLKAVGRSSRPVMVKRGMSSSIDELLLAVEYILTHGNNQVIICERGIRTFETRTRSTLDISAIPVLKRETHLPVMVDPSHAAGDRDLVPSLALAAKAVGADGIIVEIHPAPEAAMSDGPQSLRFPQFQEMMRTLKCS